MTDARMALLDLIEKTADADLVRAMLAFSAERLMAMQVETLTGAPAGVRSSERLNHRNGYRERAWDTRERVRRPSLDPMADGRNGLVPRTLERVRRRADPAEAGSHSTCLLCQAGFSFASLLATAAGREPATSASKAEEVAQVV